MILTFASNNKNKIQEIQALMGKLHSIKSLKDIGCFEDIPETQTTIEANASQKSFYVYNKYRINCFSDDTGLEIDALNGAPAPPVRAVWSPPARRSGRPAHRG